MVAIWVLVLASAGSVSADLVAHYEFENNVLDSAGSNHGTLVGNPTYTSGVFGQAISLDGADDYVSVAEIGISGAAPRTIAGWARMNQTTGIPDWTNVFGFSSTGTTDMHFDIEVVGPTGTTTAGYYGIHAYFWEQDIMPPDLEWHHFAATYDGTLIKWYGDGALVGSESHPGLNTQGDIRVGKRIDDAGGYFPGLVDDVRIYDHALSAEDVQLLFRPTGAQWCSDFNSGPPPGTSLFGNAFVDSSGGLGDGGVLKLTTATNGEQGSFIVPSPAGMVPVEAFTVSFMAYIGGGTDPPADGLSVNFASDLPDAGFGEEGAGTGLTITFDTFDNGGGEAPAIDVKWRGEVVASEPVFAVEDDFVEIVITLFEDGTLDVSWAGWDIYVGLPTAYTPIAGRFGFGARTGGLNEKHFIDELCIETVDSEGKVSIEFKMVAGDLDQDGDVDMTDWSEFADKWLMTGCASPGWCGHADLSHDGYVNFADLQALTESWLVFSSPGPQLYVGSYAKVSVNIDPSYGLTLDDLEFVIPAGPKGGQVSLSRDKHFDSMNPDIMLLAGYEPGTYHLQAVEKTSQAVLADVEFSVTSSWTNDTVGPSRWVCGDFELPGVAGAAWGGGSPTEPENYNIIPATGTNNVAILLVDTSSQRFNQSDVPTIRNLWQDVAFNGRVTNGRTVSTARYFREASHHSASPTRGLDITGQVFGPVHLPGDWNTYLQADGNYKGRIWQDCATAGDGLINYSNFEHLVCVVQSVTTPNRRVWPHADAMVAKVAEGDIPLGTVAMPADGTPFGLSATLAHELGHNLGLGDIYSWGGVDPNGVPWGHAPHIRARELWGMALMARQGDLPHPVLVHRMKLGWVPKNHLKLYNFQAKGGAVVVKETVTLHAVELGNPPAGRHSGIEVRLASGWNYYFEYRAAQASQIGDRNLWWQASRQPGDNRVLGTDVMFGDNIEDLTRRKPVMLLRNDGDGDGPVLGQGQDYKEQDTSNPKFYTDFEAEVTSTDGTKAEVLIQYGVTSQPDPSIRPWNPPVYKSPDIEVRNARSQADPKWKNVPWVKHHNTLVARVTNRGNLPASGVHVDFYVKDMTVNSSGVKRVWIGDDRDDVPAQQTVEFTTTWVPGKGEHRCIEAIIEYYRTPVAEANPYNNSAQSNYDRFISEKSSPPSREMASVTVHNPFNKRTRAFIRFAKSTSPLFRSYLEHTWLVLQPGETRNVQLMFEYAYEEDPVWNPALEQYISKPHDVSVYAVIQQPGGEPDQETVVDGGATFRVVTGKATRFGSFDIQSIPIVYPPMEYPVGHIAAMDDESGVPGGKVILVVTANGEEEYHTTEVDESGVFTGDPLGDWDSVQAYYVPLDGYGDCTSQLLVH
jgi:hypothetical protein